MSITPEQCRAGRALIEFSRDDLAERAEVSKRAIAGFENGETQPTRATLAAIRRAFELAGVSFTETGVELQKPR